MRHDEQKPDMRHRARGEAAILAETSFPKTRLYVNPAWMHRKPVRLFREILRKVAEEVSRGHSTNRVVGKGRTQGEGSS